MLPNNDEVRERTTRMLDRARKMILPPPPPPGQPLREDIPFMPNTLAALFLRPPRAAFLIVRSTMVLVIIFTIIAKKCM